MLPCWAMEFNEVWSLPSQSLQTGWKIGKYLARYHSQSRFFWFQVVANKTQTGLREVGQSGAHNLKIQRYVASVMGGSGIAAGVCICLSPDSGRLSLCGAKVASGSLVTPLERKLLGSGVVYPFLKQSLWPEGVQMA